MRVGSLFSGIGGIEIGFEREGFETVWCVERDLYAQQILRKRFPKTIIYGDITQIDFATVPKIDILTRGFPCQDISNAGKRVGITGSRSSLWKYYAEAIRILRPKYAFIENVAALVNRGLDVVLADLAEIGYDAEWTNLSASAVGAPHRRDRIFIIAYPNGIGQLHSEPQEQPDQGREQAQFNPISRGNDVQNSISNGVNERNRNNVNRGEESKEYSNIVGGTSERNVSYPKSSGLEGQQYQEGCSRSAQQGNWATESGICGVADGVSFRVDRIRCLGNAVVPQCAQVFAQAIKENWLM